ncbi:formyltransferase family protein [Vibrio sp. NH-7]
MRKVVFLVSGNGGNLKAFDLYLSKASLTDSVKLYCIADRECRAFHFCKEKNIDSFCIEYYKNNNLQLKVLLEKIKPDLIVTNWNKIIDKDLVGEYRGKLVNLHYSLLPLYGGFIGVKPIDIAYEYGNFIGVTTHEVDEGVDSGPILTQSIYRNEYTLMESYEKSFRSGALMLISDLLTKLNITYGQSVRNFEDIEFFPSLNLDISIVNDDYWKVIK